ncbi:hypothetical protein CMK11_11955 [Candidatus Poribacteria bacterium]|nr:hypothetical protein [Candidatus Poribacteria bacterium]
MKLVRYPGRSWRPVVSRGSRPVHGADATPSATAPASSVSACTATRMPCFISTSPISRSLADHSRNGVSRSAVAYDRRVDPADPQSITR